MEPNFSALVVDDESHMRSFIKFILTGLGVENIYLVRSGVEAVDAYREYEPGLVMLDINMSNMNGMAALDRIREINPDATIVMMTSVASRKTIEEARDKGATYYILKTMGAAEIEKRLKWILEKIVAKACQTT